jgi:S1-C subfamily serine protease
MGLSGPLPPAATALSEAAERGDRLGAWQAGGALLPWLADLSHPIAPGTARALVWSGAARHRWFDLAELIAGAIAARADATPDMRRLHAQMLMERGFADEALARLAPLRDDPGMSESDRGELFGHLGRIYKDRFAAAARGGDAPAAREMLARALDAYDTSFREAAGRIWHGINVVALLMRPEAAALDPQHAERGRKLAGELRVAAAGLGADLYAPAVMAEASVALGDFDAAIDAMRRFVAQPAVNVFALGSTLRQFESVWELDRRPAPWPALVALLRAALLERVDGVVRLSSRQIHASLDAASAGLEAVFGADRFDSLDNYRRGLERCACVARIGRSADTGVGTGFVLPGALLGLVPGDAFVLVTNAHVVSEREAEREKGALHPAEAIVTFAALQGVPADREFGLGAIAFSSPPEALDVTVVALSEPVAPTTAYPLAPVLPARGSDAQVRVIGHPSGRGLSLSVNRLLDHRDAKIHYRTATEGGSSGSPVFNADWKLIGLHHAGGDAMPKLDGSGETYPANEGIWIGAIRDAVAAR